jgi:hypothetical protein
LLAEADQPISPSARSLKYAANAESFVLRPGPGGAMHDGPQKKSCRANARQLLSAVLERQRRYWA